MQRKYIYNPLRRARGRKAAWWLWRELGLYDLPIKEAIDFEAFCDLLRQSLWREPTLYYRSWRRKSSGKKRLLLCPNDDLKTIQWTINQKILKAVERLPMVNGFSGGSIRAALEPHLAQGHPIFTCDLRDAFPNTHGIAVYNCFRWLKYGKNVSYFLTCLTTWPTDPRFRSSLPQGAPTSPRLFDLCLQPLDKKLQRLAKKIGGVYTRYADNIFFSAPDFPVREEVAAISRWARKKRLTDEDAIRQFKGQPVTIEKNQPTSWHASLISAIFRIINEGYYYKTWPGKGKYHGRWRRDFFTGGRYLERPAMPLNLRYDLHKCYLWRAGDDHAFKALGLQIINGRLTNTRDYKQRLRLLSHHLGWLLDHGADFETAVWPVYLQLNGQMNFAVKETLPPGLLAAAENALMRAEDIRYSGVGHTWQRRIDHY
ncbi:MAG: reverse transcriptase domain-containing protein [Patescibacteria group bacterium]